ncbi:Uncharacterised protein [Mycobacteroides abscessus subsp. abscessus]|nr:Uncharacterised protein [Mycobacteroides abscessus subsp. abscessus]SKQ37307.1 Uncharacterised protein [Mycobacteroides abscessus subsp. abscessus]
MGLSDLVGPGFFAELMYAVNAAPWDIGGPQPVIRQLVALGAVRGEVVELRKTDNWYLYSITNDHVVPGCPGSPKA